MSRVGINLTDGKGLLQVTIFSPEFENLTGMTAEQLKDREEFGFPIENDLKMVFEKLKIVFFLKPFDKDKDSHIGGTKKYNVVQAYNSSAIIGALSEATSSETAAFGLEETPEKQFFTLTTKNVLSVSEGTAAATTEKPQQAVKEQIVRVKRNLDFEETSVKGETEETKKQEAASNTTASEGTPTVGLEVL